jgi:hypothetical protein
MASSRWVLLTGRLRSPARALLRGSKDLMGDAPVSACIGHHLVAVCNLAPLRILEARADLQPTSSPALIFCFADSGQLTHGRRVSSPSRLAPRSAPFSMAPLPCPRCAQQRPSAQIGRQAKTISRSRRRRVTLEIIIAYAKGQRSVC